MNKTQLIASVAEMAEVTKKDAEKALNRATTNVIEQLRKMRGEA